ncbi:nicotinate phosphoribosyltransferase [Spiroplasma endosymbiont of Amphibalanus improvisus]|uniref:nicotinate phosphoribosyltransferase n=1 Tax=Spiroplasma endosymbiont of Amphibalanus improvisus TaxID=3066327 RepID=UPI00313BA0AE
MDYNKYIALYFKKTKKIILNEKKSQIVAMQFFQRFDNVILCGIDEVVKILKYRKNGNKLKIYALKDGDIINKNEPVLVIEGRYVDFGDLEGIIDGILSRQSSIATNSRNILENANGKIVIYMNDRSDYFYNQEKDGYAAQVGGITKFVTDSQVKYKINNPEVVGTVPHALIQQFEGDIVSAMKAYIKYFPDKPITALIDYNNNVIHDAIYLLKNVKEIDALRVDTASNLIDKYFDDKKDEFTGKNICGVNPFLIKALKQELIKNDFKNIKIIVSSGFDIEKIKYFESENTPVDIYGVGSALNKIFINFTGDLVEIDGKPNAKFGRKKQDWKRLEIK